MKDMMISGKNHNFISISALIDQLSKKLDTVKSGASEYLSNLTKLQKTCTQAIAQHDDETADLVKELHNVRDRHVSLLLITEWHEIQQL